jgi:hypothetical protein
MFESEEQFVKAVLEFSRKGETRSCAGKT